jgi:DNA-directed RNA polymerase II subunit RPB2
MYGGDEEEYDEEDEEITQEDAWAVISAYFEEKGLVRQQLDSFDEFIQNTMQEIVDESADIEIRPESQHNPGRNTETGDVSYFLLLLFRAGTLFSFAAEWRKVVMMLIRS